MKRSTAFIIAALIFSCFSLLLYYFLGSSNHQDIDSKAYIHHAVQFADQGHFASGLQPYYALGYAFFIACLYKLFGESTFVIILAQLLLALLSCVLIMRITRKLFGSFAACAAVFMFAVSVGYLVFVQFILTEVLLSFLLLLFVERFFENKFWAAGLALGLSVLVKPAGLYFIFPVLIILGLPGFLSSWGPRVFRGGARDPLITFALFFYLPITGYMLHNKIMFNNFAVSNLGAVNIYDWFLPNVLAAQNNTTSDYERRMLCKKYPNDTDFVARAGLLRSIAIHNPLLIARVWLLNMFKTAAGLYTTNLKVLANPSRAGSSKSFFSTSGTIAQRVWAYITIGASSSWIVALGLFEALWSVLRYILCVVGLFWLYKRKQWYAGVFIVLYLAYFFGITGHDGCARFRMMSEGVLIVLAAGGSACIKKEKE